MVMYLHVDAFWRQHWCARDQPYLRAASRAAPGAEPGHDGGPRPQQPADGRPGRHRRRAAPPWPEAQLAGSARADARPGRCCCSAGCTSPAGGFPPAVVSEVQDAICSRVSLATKCTACILVTLLRTALADKDSSILRECGDAVQVQAMRLAAAKAQAQAQLNAQLQAQAQAAQAQANRNNLLAGEHILLRSRVNLRTSEDDHFMLLLHPRQRNVCVCDAARILRRALDVEFSCLRRPDSGSAEYADECAAAAAEPDGGAAGPARPQSGCGWPGRGAQRRPGRHGIGAAAEAHGCSCGGARRLRSAAAPAPGRAAHAEPAAAAAALRAAGCPTSCPAGEALACPALCNSALYVRSFRVVPYIGRLYRYRHKIVFIFLTAPCVHCRAA